MKLWGQAKNCALLLNYQILNSKCSSQGMDIHGDSSKTLMEKSHLFSVVTHNTGCVSDKHLQHN